ncbi:MAG: cytochrome c biogenesis protein CcsA [Vicinamibacteria bacterium]|nr:cytochrome c biogenesis protein CcsA [Vicinamibacteria bacterium]
MTTKPGAILKRLTEGLASTRLGVALMVLLAVICSVGTFYEMKRGTAAVQEAIYATPWFAGLMAVLGVNVFLAMMAKYPWNRFHGGFVAAHIGIVLLLVGSLVSLRLGLDASLQLEEGTSSNRVTSVGRGLHALLPGANGPVALTGEIDEAAIADGTARFTTAGTDVAVVVESLAKHVEIVEGVAEGQGGPALRLALHGSFGHMEEWLMDDGHGHAQASIGPLSLELVAAADEKAAREVLRGDASQSRIGFAMLPGGRLMYALSGAGADGKVAVLEPGTEVATPWMGLKFTVLRALEKAQQRRDVAEAKPPVKIEDRTPALKAHLEGPTGRSPSFWLVWGEPQAFSLENGEAQMAFAAPQLSLPFQVTLLDFKSEKYPGSRMAATYESRVRIDDPELGSSEHLVSMNRPLHYRGYTFFQSSFIEGQPMTSILSVARAPGLPLVYAGTVFMTLGIVFMYLIKPWLVRRTAAQALAAHKLATARPARAIGRSDLRPSLPVVLLAAASCLASLPMLAAEPGDGLASLAIQDAGRLKPLDTFARETARRVIGAKPFGGGESLEGLQPAAWVLSLHGQPEQWRAKPIIRVTHVGLREAIALPAGRDRFSFDELAAHAPFAAAVQRIQERLQAEPGSRPDPVEQEVFDLEGTLSTLQAIMDGRALTIVPPGNDPQAEWLSVADVMALDTAAGGDLRPVVAALQAAARSGDLAAADARAAELARLLTARAPNAYPTALTIERELTYNRAKPFRSAWMLYLVGFLLLLSSFPLASPTLSRVGMGALVLGLISLSWGLWLRTVISGRTPLTNMYETVVFVAWGAVALALVFDLLQRSRVSSTVASGLGVLALILADTAPILDGAIHPLVPVLRDNFWLTTHVLTIMLGYASLFLAMGLGHLALGLVFFAPGRVATLKTLSKFLLRAMQVGTLFLAAGTLLGGVWASYSWGRFWGWDPKETWSLIACLGYLAILHGRLLGWLKDFGLAVGSILGFLLVLMAWYGVNYILGTGLHSYGFGSGGYTWIVAFVGFEVAVIVGALVRWRSHHAQAAVEAVPAPTRA